MSTTAVIVGSSIGGVRTAQALRRERYPGNVLIVGEETALPYDKPPLSKGFLTGTTTAKQLQLMTVAQAQETNIVLRLGTRAEQVDVAAGVLILDTGDSIDYDHLIVATGARARPSAWGEQGGLHVLRSRDDAQRLRCDLVPGRSLVVAGGGFIGAEVAAAAHSLGVDVTIVDPLSLPMGHIVGEEVGQRLAELHERNGVTTRFGTGVESIDRVAEQLAVTLADGAVLCADTVVVGIGAQPNDAWLSESGLLTDNGLVCDKFCRVEDRHEIFAVGDVARWFHPRRGVHVRVEHWTNAVEQAAAVAHNICRAGELRPYSPVEYVWSDQYDWKVQIAGHTGAGMSGVLVGGPTTWTFAALYSTSAGDFTGAMTANWPRAMMELRRLLRDEADLSMAHEMLSALSR